MNIKEIIREEIESESDYLLRISRLNEIRMFVDTLEQEAQSIKKIDLPLWYVEEHYSYYGMYSYHGIESGSWLMIREDVDPEILEWVNSCCNSCRHCVSGSGEGWKGGHPIYLGFSDEMIEIGNKVTPSKHYFKGPYLRYAAKSIREGMIKRMGDHTWMKLPTDINGKSIYR